MANGICPGTDSKAQPPESGPPVAGIIGSSPAMQAVYDTTRRVARSNASVLLLGRQVLGKS